jgi:(1->4)-alpha-D-glucan 1-alpha-D-glucosylmutase
LKTHPESLLATATHDHKRGEDVRARLAVLSEIPQQWTANLALWLRESADLAGSRTVSAGDLAILFQMIVGAWPPDLRIEDALARDAYAERLCRWQVKALREAKLATEWGEPDEAYESATRDFLLAVFARPFLLENLAAFARRIAAPGAVNGLAQAVLKATSPGVPDFYQGTEFWDFSLVDPDNRRPVDFAALALALETAHDIRSLARNWRDGRIKQAVIAHCLTIRRTHARLFASGEYIPLNPQGPAADHLIAYSRRHEAETVIVAAVRRSTRLLPEDDTIAIPERAWSGTHLEILQKNEGMIRNVFTGSVFYGPATLQQFFGDLPVAFAVMSTQGTSTN